ncbi:hypothetical protein RQP53_13200 [Paucibacter sp. APW11]|uniref:Uncharacterized protein n=1 Tax=Roseateles aquae TaxID=3077235 RepID=A0ABU3PCC0_9BURK|nr:hypothetical protein [Paucibacter sp. APW11]MDT9000225.1 hypothetical protein [Paucibacter sp. APW11]
MFDSARLIATVLQRAVKEPGLQLRHLVGWAEKQDMPEKQARNMVPAQRSANICAAISLFRHTEATRAAQAYAKALAQAQRPLRLALDANAQWQADGPLAESPSALSEQLIALLFCLPATANGAKWPARGTRETACNRRALDAQPASLAGLDVTEVWGDGQQG